jgi:hypothetical protein
MVAKLCPHPSPTKLKRKAKTRRKDAAWRLRPRSGVYKSCRGRSLERLRDEEIATAVQGVIVLFIVRF